MHGLFRDGKLTGIYRWPSDGTVEITDEQVAEYYLDLENRPKPESKLDRLIRVLKQKGILTNGDMA